MHNLSSVYIVKHIYVFREYLYSIVRRYVVWTQYLVLIVLFRWLSVVLAGFQTQPRQQTAI